MFHEYREEITKLKASDNYFHNLFEKHNALDEEIESLVKSHGDEFTIEAKKKEKLKIFMQKWEDIQLEIEQFSD